MEQFPSVYFVQVYSILIKAWVVEDLGTHPNRLSLIFLIRTGLTCPSTINSSATLDNIGASKIGRRSLFTSLIGFCFGLGLHRLLTMQVRHQGLGPLWVSVTTVSYRRNRWKQHTEAIWEHLGQEESQLRVVRSHSLGRQTLRFIVLAKLGIFGDGSICWNNLVISS